MRAPFSGHCRGVSPLVEPPVGHWGTLPRTPEGGSLSNQSAGVLCPVEGAMKFFTESSLLLISGSHPQHVFVPSSSEECFQLFVESVP